MPLTNEVSGVYRDSEIYQRSEKVVNFGATRFCVNLGNLTLHIYLLLHTSIYKLVFIRQKKAQFKLSFYG